MDCCWVVAGQMPNGSLGIYKYQRYLSAGESYIMTGAQQGLYLYQNSTDSHLIGVAVIDKDGTASVLRGNSSFKVVEADNALYMNKTSESDMVVYNKTSAGKGFNVTYIKVS